jgi:hypothetical protein
MPYELESTPSGRGYFVITKDTGRRHSKLPLTRKKAIGQLKALYVRVKDADKSRR